MSEDRTRRLTHEERKQLLRLLADEGMTRKQARRVLYGPSWKDKQPTRRATLAEACRVNARRRKDVEDGGQTGPVPEEPQGQAQGQTAD